MQQLLHLNQYLFAMMPSTLSVGVTSIVDMCSHKLEQWVLCEGKTSAQDSLLQGKAVNEGSGTEGRQARRLASLVCV